MELIYDGIHEWEGWGGAFRLGSGMCHLRIFKMSSDATKGLIPLQSTIVLVSDLAESPLSTRSCAPHLAMSIAERFGLDVRRMMYVEYRPPSSYGKPLKRFIPERYDVAEFVWHKDSGPQVKWHSLDDHLIAVIGEHVHSTLNQ